MRESFCPADPATADHTRLVLSKTVPFFCTSLFLLQFKFIFPSGSAFSDTFQMIAFLMSMFNMVALVSVTKTDANNNNNNNNNNRNENSANANQNNVNEGNANADVNAMNLIVPVGRSVAQRLLDYWNGAKRKKRSEEEEEGAHEILPPEIRYRLQHFCTDNKLCHVKLFIIPRSYAERDCTHYRLRDDIAHSLGSIFDALESFCESEQVCEKRREVAHAVTSMLELWMNSYFANHRECVERAFCSCNRDAARHGLWAWAVAEMARFVCKAILWDSLVVIKQWKKEQVWPFLVVLQLIQRLTQADISCTMARLFFFPLLGCDRMGTLTG